MSNVRELESLRNKAGRAMIGVLWAHALAAPAIGMLRGTSWLVPFSILAAFAATATIVWKSLGMSLATRLTIAVGLIAGVSIFTSQLSGHRWQIDMHMYFFSMMACLVAFCDFRIIVAGAATVAIHHLVLNFAVPALVFPDGADFGRVVLHASILIAEATVLAWVAAQLERLFHASAQRAEEAAAAQAAEAIAHEERNAAETSAAAVRKAELRELAISFEGAVGEIIDKVLSVSAELESSANGLNTASDRTRTVTSTVASSAENTSSNVQTVASAAEEMASSVGEISRQVQNSVRIATGAVTQARGTNERIDHLAEAAKRIGDVVELINNIAGQTNLLALNATIEAARAGDAGRGFAVVASEVKALADQTARATSEISQQVTNIQSATNVSVVEIQGIVTVINQMLEISTAIASAVEEQGTATQEIARNVQMAAQGTEEVRTQITGLQRDVSDTDGAASEVLSTAERLARNSELLKTNVTNFLRHIRTA